VVSASYLKSDLFITEERMSLLLVIIVCMFHEDYKQIRFIAASSNLKA
jgi:hypothetical protein